MSRDSFHRFVREDEYQALDRDRERKRDRDLFVCLSALSICLSIYRAVDLSICRSIYIYLAGPGPGAGELQGEHEPCGDEPVQREARGV